MQGEYTRHPVVSLLLCVAVGARLAFLMASPLCVLGVRTLADIVRIAARASGTLVIVVVALFLFPLL